jgi:hypothetical protein
MSSSGIKQLMIDSGLNPFGLDLFVESFLRSALANQLLDRGEPLNFKYPVDRSDCKEFSSVQITIMPILKDK